MRALCIPRTDEALDDVGLIRLALCLICMLVLASASIADSERLNYLGCKLWKLLAKAKHAGRAQAMLPRMPSNG